MSNRIYAFCSRVDKGRHTPQMCSTCPDMHFWDMAFIDMLGFIMDAKELKKGA